MPLFAFIWFEIVRDLGNQKLGELGKSSHKRLTQRFLMKNKHQSCYEIQQAKPMALSLRAKLLEYYSGIIKI